MPQSRAAELVDEYVAALDGSHSDDLQRRARGLAARAELNHPINRQPSTVAAASIYCAGLLVNEKLTQTEIAEQVGKSTTAIGDCNHELLQYEGIAQPTDDPEQPPAPWWRRFLRRAVR